MNRKQRRSQTMEDIEIMLNKHGFSIKDEQGELKETKKVFTEIGRRWGDLPMSAKHDLFLLFDRNSIEYRVITNCKGENECQEL